MRVNRTLLYAGVFVVAIGAGLLIADLRQLGSSTLIELLGYWPLAVIALGLGLVLRQTDLGLPSGLLAAAVPGLVLGGVLALGPLLAVERNVWQELGAAYEWRYDCADIGAHFDLGMVDLHPMGGCP
jgi:hypothetical protein